MARNDLRRLDQGSHDAELKLIDSPISSKCEHQFRPASRKENVVSSFNQDPGSIIQLDHERSEWSSLEFAAQILRFHFCFPGNNTPCQASVQKKKKKKNTK